MISRPLRTMCCWCVAAVVVAGCAASGQPTSPTMPPLPTTTEASTVPVAPETAEVAGTAEGSPVGRNGLLTAFIEGSTTRLASELVGPRAAPTQALAALIGQLADRCDSADDRLAAWGELADAIDAAAAAWAAAAPDDLEFSNQMTLEVAETAALTGCPGMKIDVTAEVRAVTQRLIGAVDRLALAVEQPEGPFIGRYWDADMYAVLRELVGGANPEVLVIGSSVGRRGIDAAQLEELIGRRVTNAAISGGFAEFQVHWLPEVLGHASTDAASVDHVIWVVSELDLYGLCLAEFRENRFVGIQQRRVGAFPDVVVEGGPLERTQLLIGPGNGESFLVDLANERRDGVPLSADEASADAQVATYAGSFTSAEWCDYRIDRLAGEIERLAADGMAVTVVALPTAQELTSLHPARASGSAADMERLLTMSEAVGAETLNASDIDQSLLVDATHLGEDGKAIATERLAAFLE